MICFRLKNEVYRLGIHSSGTWYAINDSIEEGKQTIRLEITPEITNFAIVLTLNLIKSQLIQIQKDEWENVNVCNDQI